jgi:cell division protein FtsQ
VSGNFFTVDLEITRQAFEKLPWVRKVSVRRKFPWSLEVEVEEQVALAHWNGKELVNTHGEVFAGKVDQDLPVFTGQPDSSQQVTQMYGELNAALQPMKQQIAQISLSPRYAWQVKLDNGMVLELGREEMQQRLKRFVTVYPYSLAALARPASHVDLRYRNGFAAYMAGNV